MPLVLEWSFLEYTMLVTTYLLIRNLCWSGKYGRPLRMPKISAIIHTDEALLATLFIFIVHWWNVHYSPEVFPMSNAWLTGNLSEEQMKHEHLLEYEEIMRQMQEKNARLT